MREELGDDHIAQYMADYTPGDFTMNGGAFYIVSDTACVSIGTTDGMDSWTYALGGEELLEGCGMALLNVQAPNVFPERSSRISISTSSRSSSSSTISHLFMNTTM